MLCILSCGIQDVCAFVLDQGVLARVKLCREGLDDTEHQYTLVLGSRRNMMMRLNAFMASTMMFTAIFSLIPGWFGTNFDSIQFVTSFNGMAILTGCGILLSSFLSYLILSRII